MSEQPTATAEQRASTGGQPTATGEQRAATGGQPTGRRAGASPQAKRICAARVEGEVEDPRAKRWQRLPAVNVALHPVPIALQPTRYIRTAWAQRPYGMVRELSARAAHDGQRLHLLVEWVSPTRQIAAGERNPYGEHPFSGPDAFPDAVAVLFPSGGDAPIETMGADDAAINMWRWTAGVPDTVQSLIARGIATEQPVGERSELRARSAGAGERWSVLFSRPLGGGDEEPSFHPGGTGRVGFAAWCGANQERAGLMAACTAWIDLELDA